MISASGSVVLSGDCPVLRIVPGSMNSSPAPSGLTKPPLVKPCSENGFQFYTSESLARTLWSVTVVFIVVFVLRFVPRPRVVAAVLAGVLTLTAFYVIVRPVYNTFNT